MSSKTRHTMARHGELSTPRPLASVLKVLGVVLAVVLVSGAAVAAYAAFDLTSSFQDGAVDLGGEELPPDIGAIEGGVNLLLAGTDACEPEYAGWFGERCEGEDAEAELNDVNMLVHISDEPRRVTVVSFPRDLMVSIPSCTAADGSATGEIGRDALNTAYHDGGLACVVKTIEQLTGLSIPYAAKVTWGGVIEITNAIGGVEVCIENGIQDEHTGIDWPAGTREIQGIEALQFLRTRHGVGNGGDLGRISNQQQYMSRLARKLVSDEVLTNPATLYKLATTAVDNVTPSQSLTNPMTLAQIALAVKNVPFDEIVFVQYPVVDDEWDPNRVAPNFEAAQALWDALATGQAIALTGEASQGEGVVVVEPSAEPSPSASTDPSAPPVVQLPPTIPGQTAAQDTCSNGNAG